MFQWSKISIIGSLSRISAGFQILEQHHVSKACLQYYSTSSVVHKYQVINDTRQSTIINKKRTNTGIMKPTTVGNWTFNPSIILIPSRNFAARKGTRTRKEKKKVKKEVVKRQFIFKNIRKQMELPYQKQRPYDDSHHTVPVDDVYFTYKFISKKWPFAEAIQNFREVNHPTVYDIPNAPVSLRVNIDLTYPNRPNKFQDGWKSVIEMESPFLLQGMERPSVLAFCIEDSDYIADVLKAGADMAGAKELIKAIQEGEVNQNDYEYIVAHPSIVPDLTGIRGLIKKKFPMIKNRTISTDVAAEVKRLKSGIKVRVEKNDREPDYGFFETPIGTLEMTNEDLEKNFLSILKDTVPRRVPGKSPEKFIISCVLRTIHDGRLREHFKVDLTPYLIEFVQSKKSSQSQSEYEEQGNVDEKKIDSQ